MISREPTLERLAIAQAVLLDPFGLNEATLARALTTIGEHRADDADLYFQLSRSESWMLEEGQVKSGSFASTRAWACAWSPARRPPSPTADDISPASLEAAAKVPRARSRRRARIGGGRHAGVARGRCPSMRRSIRSPPSTTPRRCASSSAWRSAPAPPTRA